MLPAGSPSSIRGNRTATPDLGRVDLAIPSKPLSNTSAGWAESLERVVADEAVDLSDLRVGQPEYALQKIRHQLLASPPPEPVVGIEARAPPLPAYFERSSVTTAWRTCGAGGDSARRQRG